MEPVSIIVIILLAVLGSGAGHQALKRHKKKQREALRQALLQKLPGPDRYVSLFDIFWDLGVSDFALTIMAHQDLLPKGPQDMPDIFQRLDDRIHAHGSYEAFIGDVLEAIQEFYRAHQMAGDRRLLPTLQTRAQKLLPVGQGQVSPGAPTNVETERARQDELPEGYLLDIAFEQRARIRESRSATGGALVPSRGTVDIDDVLRAGPMDLMRGLLSGRLGEKLTRWVQMRQLRSLRAELDRHLAALHDHYASMARRTPNFFAPLYDLTRRWEREARRITQLERERPWADRPHALAGDLLMEESRILAGYLARHAKKNTDEAIASIQGCAVKGDEAMAGYLVYVNRFAFFAGRGDGHAPLVTDIEHATARIQAELRELQSRRII